MLPTPPTAHWGRYGHYHPDPHYFLGRAPPSALAGAGAAEAATAAAAAATAPHPPPMSWHHYYYGRGMRRGLGFRRFVWFGLGIAAATWYFRSKERARRYEIDHGSQVTTGAPPCGPGWGWSAQRDLSSSNPTTPVPAASPAVFATPSEPVTASLPSQRDDSKSEIVNEARRGWGHRWHRHSRRDAGSEPTASGGAAAASAPGAAVDGAIATDADDLQKLKQAVERLWAEKKVEATAAQQHANEKAREYASEKLDKLAAALETLRETLRAEMPKSERKI